VLFTSGYTENAIVHGGRLDRGVELIGKPYTKESLARKLRHVLANQKQKTAGKLPAAAAATVAALAEPAPAPAAAGGLHILLVEDEGDIRENTREMMEFLGHRVIAVATAEEAMDKLSLDIDLLVTDVQLPGIQGGDLAQLARAQFPHLKVLLASGYGGVAVPGADMLPKPYTLESLRAVLDALRPATIPGTAASAAPA